MISFRLLAWPICLARYPADVHLCRALASARFGSEGPPVQIRLPRLSAPDQRKLCSGSLVCHPGTGRVLRSENMSATPVRTRAAAQLAAWTWWNPPIRPAPGLDRRVGWCRGPRGGWSAGGADQVFSCSEVWRPRHWPSCQGSCRGRGLVGAGAAFGERCFQGSDHPPTLGLLPISAEIAEVDERPDKALVLGSTRSF